MVLWFTGLSGSGKSTLAHAVEARLHTLGHLTFVLDGDNLRHGLCADLGFSREDRAENIRRVGETARLLVEAGVLVLTAFISPFDRDREGVRALFAIGDFAEIYCRCPLETCELRDIKGFYRRARTGDLPDFTGISSPYEVPPHPELIVDTGVLTVDTSVELILQWLEIRGILRTDVNWKQDDGCAQGSNI